MKFHEAACLFPLDEENIGSLADDIRANGQLIAIELLGDEILDGRRRFMACKRAGVDPKFRQVDVSDPVQYVMSLNLQRRQLDKGQLAMVASRAREIYDRLAKERQVAGRQRGSEKQKGMVDTSPPSENTGKARDQAAAAVGVSGRTVDCATKVLNKGIPELIEAVDAGKVGVWVAAEIADMPDEEQIRELENPKTRGEYLEEKKPSEPPPEQAQEIKSRGVGVRLAHEALNCLTRIPKNDQLRGRGFQIVTDWIKSNK